MLSAHCFLISSSLITKFGLHTTHPPGTSYWLSSNCLWLVEVPYQTWWCTGTKQRRHLSCILDKFINNVLLTGELITKEILVLVLTLLPLIWCLLANFICQKTINFCSPICAWSIIKIYCFKMSISIIEYLHNSESANFKLKFNLNMIYKQAGLNRATLKINYWPFL